MLNDTSWGSWKFHLSSEEFLNVIGSFPGDQTSNAVQLLILRARNHDESAKSGSSWKEISEVFNDLTFELKRNNVARKTPKNERVPSEPTEPSHIDKDPFLLAKELVQILGGKQKDKQSVMSILSHQTGERLTNLLMNTWTHMSSLDQKKIFITSISSNLEARSCVCLNIIRPWMLDNFLEAFEALNNLMPCLGASIVETILSLADGEESLFVRESNSWKDVLCSLDPGQQNETARKLIHCINQKLESWHLTLLTAMTETSLSESNLEELLGIIEREVNRFSRDRYMGKLLANIIHFQLSSSSSVYFIDKTASLIQGYRGIMKATLQRNLDNLRKDVSV